MNIIKRKSTSGRIHRYMLDSLKNGKNEPSCCVSKRLSGSNEDVRDNREEDNIIRGEMLTILLRVFDVYRNKINFTFQNR